jgi:hypothetical protein
VGQKGQNYFDDHFLTKTLQFVNLATNQFTAATVALYWEPYKQRTKQGERQ